ncbi:MAG: SDR family oxidoreductase [Myxococcota bacterium]
MTTLVTGANGHIGENLVRALVERGERVRALIGPRAYPDPLDGLDVEAMEGDVRDPASLWRAVEGCERVYHLASHVSIRDNDRQRLYEVNVLGVRNVMQACLAAGVRRVVHTSSIEAVGKDPNGDASDEDTPSNPFEPLLDYEVSKVHGELEALRAVVRGLDVVIVNPAAVVGPHDYRPSSIGQAIVDFAHGRIPAYIGGAFDFVPVRDVVQGHLLAMELGRCGERYLLCGQVVTLDQVFAWMAEDVGRPKPPLRIPAPVMVPVAIVGDAVRRAVAPERSPRLTRGSIRVLTSGKHGSNAKARRELGLTPTPVREAFREAAAHFRARGLID